MRLFPSLLLAASLHAPALGQQMAATGDEAFPVLPAPARAAVDLRWSGPEGLWAQAEVPAGPAKESAPRGAVSAGRRLVLADCGTEGLFGCRPMRLQSTTVLRGLPGAAAGGEDWPSLGLGFVQDAEMSVTPGLTLRAGLDFGDRLGIGAPAATGGSGVAVKARAGIGTDLGALGAGVPLRLDLSFAVVQDIGATSPGRRPDDCTGTLAIRWDEFVALRMTAQCGPGGRGLGFGLRGEF